MNTFCPLIKDECKKDECVMWGGAECLVVEGIVHCRVFSHAVTAGEAPEEVVESEADVKVLHAADEDLADEAFRCLAQKGFQSETQFFWRSKGVDKFFGPATVREKISRVEEILDKRMEEARLEREQHKREEERSRMPELIEQCLRWAKQNGLTKVQNADAESFLCDVRIELCDSFNKKMLRIKVSEKLKRDQGA